jgi:hypothetical protein
MLKYSFLPKKKNTKKIVLKLALQRANLDHPNVRHKNWRRFILRSTSCFHTLNGVHSATSVYILLDLFEIADTINYLKDRNPNTLLFFFLGNTFLYLFSWKLIF